MIKSFIYIFIVFTLDFSGYAQKSDFSCEVSIVTEHGNMIKARNNGQQTVTFRITYVTEGRNQTGEMVSSVKEQSEYIEIGPGEEIQIYTAPRDPQGKITYVFKNIVITECSTTKPSVIPRGINTRKNGGN